ncbi:uncharacterized protein TNCV_4102081 [Trichonephila clavipes]|nr:uncharacterized protein TNCV_4102081 [Trichonephila clavipes]
MDDPIYYQFRVISIATGTSVKCDSPKSFPFFKASLELSFSKDMSPGDHAWYLVGRCLTRDPRPAASKDKLLLRIQAIWNSLPQVNIQNMFDFLPRRIAAFIAVLGGYTKY